MVRAITPPLAKHAKRGFRGYPMATIAYYGPDASDATKVAVGILATEGGPTVALERWFSNELDVRIAPQINRAVIAFIRAHGARTVVLSPGIVGCAHEEGIDYPKGQACPKCPYWRDRDRWTGEIQPP